MTMLASLSLERLLVVEESMELSKRIFSKKNVPNQKFKKSIHFVMKIEKSMKILMAVFNLIFVQIYDENWNVMGKV
jgi:hypothetical protein